jgi:hypothetical protein
MAFCILHLQRLIITPDIARLMSLQDLADPRFLLAVGGFRGDHRPASAHCFVESLGLLPNRTFLHNVDNPPAHPLE